MLLDAWSATALLLTVSVSALAGYLAAAVTCMGLRRNVRSLEYEVSDLETRVVREVKMRAGKEGVRARKQEEELIEQIAQQPAPQPQPWWMQYVAKDLRQ